jgi:hypothetical protein
MSTAAALLDRLGRPGHLRLGTAHPSTIARLATGLGALDQLLDGGLPRGRVTELTGAPSAGRTALACATAAAATRGGEVVAWIDPADALDPETVAAAGVELARTLWVRPRDAADALRAAELVLGAGGFGLVVLDLDVRPQIPDAVWARCTRAAETTRSALLVVAPEPVARTNATLGLVTTAQGPRWDGTTSPRLLDGIATCIAVVRNRAGRPGQTLLIRQSCA